MSSGDYVRFPTIWNPNDHIMYAYRYDPFAPSFSEEPTYDIPLMDTSEYMTQLNGESKAASTASLDRVFFNNGKEQYNFLDKASVYYDKVAEVQNAPKREQMSKAAAVIMSSDFPDFQNTLIIGQNLETSIRRGILSSQFQSVALPNLAGKWANFANDLKYYRNIPEGRSPEPSLGSGSITTVETMKHGGAVAITQRAQAVINGDNPFQRFVAQMQDKRSNDENAMVAALIESQTTNTMAGVDFGVRSGTPPLSTQNPIDTLTTLITTFESLSQPLNLFVSRGFMFNEYSFNDIVRGGATSGNPLPTQQNINEQSGPFPGLGGVTWARDNAITSTTKGWAMNSNAIKIFTAASLNYTVVNDDTETTKYVTKNWFNPVVVDSTLIYQITGIAA